MPRRSRRAFRISTEWTNGLTIGQGRIALRIEVLAPNHRPIQITDDLATFWRESYPKIKQELQRKYPKHHWR